MAKKKPGSSAELEHLSGMCAAIETLLICVIWLDDERLELVRTMFAAAVDNFIDGVEEQGLSEVFAAGFITRATELMMLLGKPKEPGDTPAANDEGA